MTLQEAIRGMVERAVADGYFTGNRVMLLDLLTQLGCVWIDAELTKKR